MGGNVSSGSASRAMVRALTEGIRGASPLFLHANGRLSTDAVSTPEGLAARDALVGAARWVSSRRRVTFERLFPASPFHPQRAVRDDRLGRVQVEGLLAQLRGALTAAAVGGPAATADPENAAQIRSAAVTLLAHVIATVLRVPTWRGPADEAAALVLDLIDAERDHATARPALRAHAIGLLQRRAPALCFHHQRRTHALLVSLVRPSPPYATLPATWRFALCSAWDFHEGGCEALMTSHGFAEVAETPVLPTPGLGTPAYRVLRAPFRGPAGQPIEVWARIAQPETEHLEMANPAFTGLLINRHAQLGAFDMRATTCAVRQDGYKLLMSAQCSGLTTRFAIARMFPDADIYSSWDATYFRQDPAGRLIASEGLDCFVAVLGAMARGESHRDISGRIRTVQWAHALGTSPDFVQFVGPAHPRVLARMTDLNEDGRADCYDGFHDFTLRTIAEDVAASATPRDPGVTTSQVGGAAARGLAWAAGSLNRVAQYSDIWAGLPGDSENQYVFQAAGFYSHVEPPDDDGGPLGFDPGRLPALCRYVTADPMPTPAAAFTVDVLFHSWGSHAAAEYKRLLCAAAAFWRALDQGYLPRTGALTTAAGQRGALLLTLAGLLEYPADQNHIDALWAMALRTLHLPVLSRSAVRACITEGDHRASNYYGSYRGLAQLVGPDGDGGALAAADPVAFAELQSADARVGRAGAMVLRSAEVET